MTLRLPTPLRAAVAAEAERRGTTFSDAARQALADWIDPEAGFLAGVPALTPVAIPTDEGAQEHLGEELARTLVETLKASATDYPTKRALARILRAAASGLTAAVPEVEAEAALAEPF